MNEHHPRLPIRKAANLARGYPLVATFKKELTLCRSILYIVVQRILAVHAIAYSIYVLVTAKHSPRPNTLREVQHTQGDSAIPSLGAHSVGQNPSVLAPTKSTSRPLRHPQTQLS